MDAYVHANLQSELRSRRELLDAALADSGRSPDLVRLLREVDAALDRIETDHYGNCDACHEPLEDDQLLAHPLLTWCLCNLTQQQQDALQRDLDLASRIQWALLPPTHLTVDGWETAYRYVPAGPVSGDYCDVARRDNGLWFLAGDVMGHGVAASFLMARLNALFRTLIEFDLPLHQIVERTNRLFRDAASENHFATLVAGRAAPDGVIEVCNAGHPAPLVVSRGRVREVGGGGLPVGVSQANAYTTERVVADPGDVVLLYTDGLVETRAPSGDMYGVDRVTQIVEGGAALPLPALAGTLLSDANRFRGDTRPEDDITLLLLRRGAAES